MIDIRLADPAAPELHELLASYGAQARTNWPDDPHQILDARMMRAQGLEFWAAFDDDRAVACGALLARDDGSAELRAIHVLKDMRGRGIARQMMEHLAEEAYAAGQYGLVVATRAGTHPGCAALRGFFQALGYESAAPMGGADLMWLQLRQAA